MDDDSSYRGEDIAIWTNDEAIAGAMHAMAEKIWSTGTRPSLPDATDAAVPKRVA